MTKEDVIPLVKYFCLLIGVKYLISKYLGRYLIPFSPTNVMYQLVIIRCIINFEQVSFPFNQYFVCFIVFYYHEIVKDLAQQTNIEFQFMAFRLLR